MVCVSISPIHMHIWDTTNKLVGKHCTSVLKTADAEFLVLDEMLHVLKTWLRYFEPSLKNPQ